MSAATTRTGLLFVTCLVLCTAVPQSFAGKPQKWDDVPRPVQETILKNGGQAGSSVDKESERKDGLAIYEAGVKDKDGNVRDLVITADGKLVEIKTDDAADLAAERAARAKKVL